jgi:hypothetical protein
MFTEGLKQQALTGVKDKAGNDGQKSLPSQSFLSSTQQISVPIKLSE